MFAHFTLGLFFFFFAYTSAFMKVQKVVLEFDQDLSKENYSML